MEHVVFYPSAEGLPAFERVGSLDEAVGFVEHLRNSFNITEFSVQALTPVPLSFRAYYHVEVPKGAEAAAIGGSSAPAASPAQAPDEDRSAAWVAEAPVAEPPAAAPAASAWDVPFAAQPQDAPQAPAQYAQSAPDAATDTEAEVASAPVPSGRRSMGFFAR